MEKELIETLQGLLRIKDQHIKKLEEEIDVLRHYGNKDCTAMADGALEEKRRTGKYPFED